MSESAPSFSAPFSEMAARIEHNKPGEFGGAFVIVPPAGDAVTVLNLDGVKDAALFWSMVQARMAVVIKQVTAQMDQQQRDPWRRG